MTEDFSIAELGPLGDGICPTADGPVFVDRALPGDVVTARLHTGAGGIRRGDVIAIQTPSPHRIAAKCIHYDGCGGCALQHATDDFYRSWKQAAVRATLAKQGVVPDAWLEPVFVGAGTRRRTTFATMKRKGVVTLGYFRRRTHDVIDAPECLVIEPRLVTLRAKLAPALKALLVENKALDVFVQNVDGAIEVVLTGPIGARGKPDLAVFQATAQWVHQLGLARVYWRAHDRQDPEVLVEGQAVIANFGALQVRLPPLSFLQPSKIGEGALTKAVTAALPDKGRFADLFCGSGTLSGAMVARGKVDAFDSSDAAISALQKAAAGLPLKATARDLLRNPISSGDLKRYDAVVFDPPRVGSHEQAKQIAASSVPCVVAVSCNPATFARDARVLLDGGYQLKSLQLVDQFTWTAHAELVGVFHRPADHKSGKV